jgi:hypothetical protein
MDLIVNFAIEESSDAQSFVFIDNTGEYSLTNPTGWTAGLKADLVGAELVMESQDGTIVLTYILPVGAGFEDEWAQGIEIFTGDIGYPGAKYEDGVYDFTLNLTFTVEGEHSFDDTFGFAAQIITTVMGEALTYRESQSKSHREYILERIRLKDNLFYSAETGQLEYFQINLDHLYKMK